MNWKQLYLLILFSAFIFLIYSNTFESSWHFDDFPNIVNNPSLHLENLNLKSIIRSFFADPVYHNKIYRPFAGITFAINWYFCRDHVSGYHIVNIIIHIVNTWLLFLVIRRLLSTQSFKDNEKEKKYLIAFMASGLWAVNPIQTQAVTYIVQRMVLMSTTFYLLSVLFYLKARLHDNPYASSVLYFGCMACFILALGSKENAVMLPFALLLMEICFFRQIRLRIFRKQFLYFIAGGILCILLVGISVFFVTGTRDIFFFLKGFEDRSFTLSQRLLTEPRIIVLYLSQIFYPIPQRLSFAHDITISTSVIAPWTTLPAILFIFLSIGLSLSQVNKRPVIAFSIIFFFLNHIVESSFIPLELVFEHRNYLPSLFLFLPVSTGLHSLLRYYEKNNRFIYKSLISLVIIFIMLMGVGTYVRNRAWATEISLWTDAQKKAPGNARASQNIALYYKKTRQYNKALSHYKKSLYLYSDRPGQSKALAYNNMGNIYRELGAYETAVSLYEKALSIFPINQTSRLNMINTLIEMKKWADALRNINYLISNSFYLDQCYHLKGLVLIRLKRYPEAIESLEKAMELSPGNPEIITKIGMAYSLMGSYEQAAHFLKQAKALQNDNVLISLYLIETWVKYNKLNLIDQNLDDFFSRIQAKDIFRFIENQQNDSFSIPLDRKRIIPVLAEKFRNKQKKERVMNLIDN